MNPFATLIAMSLLVVGCGSAVGAAQLYFTAERADRSAPWALHWYFARLAAFFLFCGVMVLLAGMAMESAP